jgi:hypothetical protein
MADQRCSPRVLTAVLWADRQAGWDSLIFFRPLAVIDSSTRPPRPPPSAFAKPSRCNGRRFRTSVVRSIPSQSLNSAMLQLSLAFNASKIVPCVGRIPCRRISASKNRVMTRVTQRKLKQTQFSIADRSSSLGMVCICTTGAKLSSDFWFLNFQRLCRGQKYLKITPSRKARCPSTPRSPDALAEACAALAKATNTSRICVTRAAEGAALWENGNLLCARAPQVTVKDTVRAGDSFMAGHLTRGIDTQKVLENACRVGAFVASHNGATPLLPPEITQEFKRV